MDGYYVRLPDGDVQRVTLDELDHAFQAGHIDASTLVLADGGGRWIRLGQLAGLDDSAPRLPQPASFAHARPMAPAIHSHRPVSIDLSDLDLNYSAHRRSGKPWIAALVGFALVGTLGGVGVSRPGWARPYLTRIGLAAAPMSAPAAAAPSFVAPAPPADAIVPLSGATTASPTLALPADGSALAAVPAPPTPSNSAGVKPVGVKARAHKAHAIPAHSHTGSPKTRPAPFSTGGNKYDPLNSSI